ncbi:MULTISPECIES: protease modulator HflC [unclassified Wenzhouxiangella]|uniref:protease modulator HflC n=1 Tax=unclassified Wenzhouxiangella TaxID=2613841 RepID=UPI000E325796|nr:MULTISPECIES: protease modulator HflC [unclassified Wenzhouxiangella]RFF28138.1 protease modulator HflC [Wenzhouxiangella sp. 15181]RFP68064.1 protease modulator HflC [Wenzhouxiangella sp. 15190]
MKTIIIAIVAIVLIAGGNFVFYTVDEAEQAIIVQFGEPMGDVISEPGLKVKLPWQNVRRFDKRLLVWDGDVTQIPTLGREFILVDTTARWRIDDPLLFLTSVRDEAGARTRLDDIVDSVVRDMVSSTELEEIVRSKDWEVDVDDLADPAMADRGDINLEKQPKLGRELLETEILERARDSMPTLGIVLDDVRVKRVNYIDSVRKQVENRMIAERQSIAERFRSEGKGRSQEILGNMERDLRRIRSEAEREAEEIRGEADAEATQIYGEAFGAEPEFYSFFRTLESYRALGPNATIMLSADSDFFRYLEESQVQ